MRKRLLLGEEGEESEEEEVEREVRDVSKEPMDVDAIKSKKPVRAPPLLTAHFVSPFARPKIDGRACTASFVHLY